MSRVTGALFEEVGNRMQMLEWENETTVGPKENVFTDKTDKTHSRRPRHRLTDREARRQNADA